MRPFAPFNEVGTMSAGNSPWTTPRGQQASSAPRAEEGPVRWYSAYSHLHVQREPSSSRFVFWLPKRKPVRTRPQGLWPFSPPVANSFPKDESSSEFRSETIQ